MDRKVIGAVAVVAVVRKDTVEQLRRNHEGKAPCDMVRRIGPGAPTRVPSRH